MTLRWLATIFILTDVGNALIPFYIIIDALRRVTKDDEQYSRVVFDVASNIFQCFIFIAKVYTGWRALSSGYRAKRTSLYY